MAVYQIKSSSSSASSSTTTPASVAPSPYSGLPNHLIEERQDVIFRRVRGILNKITPETFDKLSKELVNVGLDSPRTLRGVIYLLFDKALKDLKYSSLYAKLCQELSEKAPNFEQEPGPNTFCKFLISKCEDEFERRRKATEDFDTKKELTDEEYEQKAIVKQKMLGNIKFICELGKKRLLQEEILHECIRGLLSKKKERPIQDQAQDLECLCQIMRTIGSLLDIKASKNLMNQYFDRIDMFSKKPELPSRIRFMLRDVIDLRNNNWRPRPFQREDNVPQPLSKLREEAGFDTNTNHSSVDKFGNNRGLIGIGDLSKLHGNKLSMYLDDEPSFTTSTDFHWGPSFLPMEHSYDLFSSNTTPVGKKQSNAVFTSSANSAFTSITSTTASATPNLTPPSNFHKPHPFQQASDPFSRQDIGNPRFDNNKPNQQQQHPFKPIDSAIAAKPSGESRRFLDGRGSPFEKVPMHDPSYQVNSNFRNDRETSRHRMVNNNINHPVRMQPQQNRDFEQQPFNNSNSSVVNQRRFVESRAQPPISRGNGNGNLSPNAPRPPPLIRRNYQMPNDQQQAPPQNSRFEPRPPLLSQMPPPPPPTHPPASEVNPENRDRRYIQPKNQNYHDNYDNPRQPKFNTSANYRISRNDRGPLNRGGEHHYFDKPESDLDFNWRTGPIGPSHPTNLANNVNVINHPPPIIQHGQSPPTIQKPRIIPIESNEIRKDRPNNNNMNNNYAKQTTNEQLQPPHQHNVINSRQAENLNFDTRPQALNRDILKPFPPIKHLDREPQEISSSSDCNRSQSTPQPLSNSSSLPSNNNIRQQQQQYGEIRDSQTRLQGAHTSPSRAVIKNRSPHEANQSQQSLPLPPPNHQYQPHSRSIQGDIPDRREAPTRRFYSSSHSQDHYESHQQRPKNSDPEVNHHQQHHHHHHHEPNHRFNFGRNNQQLDNSGVTESDRVPNWRKAPIKANPNTTTSNNNNNNNTSTSNNNNNNSHSSAKEQPSLVPSHLLPKPPAKISDVNFSLRPSHNLIGRVIAPPVSQQTNLQTPLKSSPSGQNIQDQSDVKNNSKSASVAPISSEPQNDKENEVKPSNHSEGNQSTKKASEFHVNKFMSLVSEFSYDPSPNVNRVATKIRELKIPKNYQHECLVGAMKQSILRAESDRANVRKLFVQIIPSIFESSTLLNAFRIIFEQMHGLEVETPKVKSLVAEFLSQSISDGLLNLQEVGNVLAGGKHHPLFLLVLQKLEKSGGQAWLNEKFVASKINLIDMLPEVDRTKERLASILKDRCLGFLDPMLTIEPDLWEQMKGRDPSPAAVYRWIKENVDQTIQSTPTFAHVLISCLMRYIHRVAMEKSANQKQEDGGAESESSKSSPSMASQNTADIEKEMLVRFQGVLQAILIDKQMQLAILYALQSFFHGLDFPKGSLLRWFHMLYDMNIVDDDVFFIWKEEINDEFPGKGQALFQVNTWLNWLAEAEEEEEDDEEEEEDDEEEV